MPVVWSKTRAPEAVQLRIDYVDGRQAVGEVGWHADRTLQEMWGNTFKQQRHQVIDLPSGTGTWSVHLGRGANIKLLYAQLGAFIQQLIDSNLSRTRSVRRGGPTLNLCGTCHQGFGVGEGEIAILLRSHPARPAVRGTL